jgi:hypothetical protein
LAKDQIAATAKAAEDAYEALLSGESPEAVVEKLTKAGISLAQLGYTGKDLLGMARRMTKDGFRKFFSACFAAGTKIRTDRGWVAIEDVQAGDQVWSRSEAGPDHPGSYQTVELTMRRSSPIVALRVGGQVIRTTLEHPFWVRHKGWTATRDLRFGDELAGKDGEWTTVDAIDSTNEYANVYNIGVSKEHTYFVGDDGWEFSVWAHNTDGECQVPANGSKEQKQALNAPQNALNWIWKSVKTFGHTFNRHGAGAKNTKNLAGRAAGTGDNQGQWKDNEAAAKFLEQQRPTLTGPKIVDLPPGVQGQVIKPDGTIVPATRAQLVPNESGGYTSAYPIE